MYTLNRQKMDTAESVKRNKRHTNNKVS